MDTLINSVQALSALLDFAQLQRVLKESQGLLSQQQAQLVNLLPQLTHDQHALSIIHFLSAIFKGNYLTQNPQVLSDVFDYMGNFLPALRGPTATVQVQLEPEMLCKVCRKYKELLMAADMPRRGVVPLRCALRALQPNREVLTPIHADFLQLCLLSQCYSAAIEVLDDDIYDVAPHATTATPTDLFLYAYYGARLLIGRAAHARALELLLVALTAPSQAGNAIVLAAYKLYVLVSLIHAGSLTPLPRYTSAKVRALVEVEGKAYADLAAEYSSHSVERIRKVVDKHQAQYAADGVIGLLHQVQASLAKRHIQRLTRSYLALPLADIASAAGLPSAQAAEMMLLGMVASGDIHARISADGMVTFTEDDAQAAPGPLLARLDASIKTVMQLNERVNKTNDAVSADRAYVSKVASKERRGYDLGGNMGMNIDDFAASAAMMGSEP